MQTSVLARLSLGLGIAVLASSLAQAQRTAPVLDRSQTLKNPSAHGLSGTFQYRPDSARRAPPTPAGEALPRILLTGYWPPSNEAIRRFSPDPGQNPDGWLGSNWESRGYDVYSYFPEFNPRDCNNCGKGNGDLEVDYQDTSLDFWRIVDDIQPIAIITLSRGYIDHNWELEMNQYNRDTWTGDYVTPFQPTPAPPDDSVPGGHLRNSSLPVQAIVDAVNAANIGVNAYICYSGDGGGFLSEFAAYHGVWSKEDRDSPADPNWCIAGGHIHVGGQINWSTAQHALRISLRETISYVDSIRAGTECQADIGFGGPGSSELRVCGQSLSAGNTADMMLSGAPASTTAFLIAGIQNNPTPFKGGLLVPIPFDLFRVFVTDEDGRVTLPGIPGGNGPLTVFGQFVLPDPLQTQGFSISNTVQIEFQQ